MLYYISKKNKKAHLLELENNDTLCRMKSTGGLSTRFYSSPTKENRELCHLCNTAYMKKYGEYFSVLLERQDNYEKAKEEYFKMINDFKKIVIDAIGMRYSCFYEISDFEE